MTKKGIMHFIKFFSIAMAASLGACNNTANNVSHYTPDNKNDTVHSSGGIVNTSAGEEIFRQRCSACHGINGDARNNNAENLQQTRLDSLGIVTTVRHGRGAMPMFDSEALPDSSLAQVEMYVKTLRKY